VGGEEGGGGDTARRECQQGPAISPGQRQDAACEPEEERGGGVNEEGSGQRQRQGRVAPLEQPAQRGEGQGVAGGLDLGGAPGERERVGRPGEEGGGEVGKPRRALKAPEARDQGRRRGERE